MFKDFLECGKIVSAHGVRGEVKILPWCDGAEYLLDFLALYLDKGAARLNIESARVHKGMLIAKFEGVNSIDDTAKLRGRVVYLSREEAPPDEDGVFFVQDLMGLEVIDADSRRIWGRLTQVYQTGANDVYEITGEDGEKRLIPAIKEVVISTDLEAGIMEIRPLKGLFDSEGIDAD